VQLDVAGAVFSVSFTVINTDSVKGVAVSQVYVGPPANVATSYPDVQLLRRRWWASRTWSSRPVQARP